ncbi:MAG: TonB-dependent receptor [Candidatus Kapaibacterium sp.]|nr:MAG: TonB-dependent receptor [Candidatus Kapabacteria bacterium]
MNVFLPKSVSSFVSQLSATIFRNVYEHNFLISNFTPNMKTLCLFLCAALHLNANSITAQTITQPTTQTTTTASTKITRTKNVVITATRTERDAESSPIPTMLISAEQMRAQASVRLSDVLAEQTGLGIVLDHGQGIQVQGLDPAYTLILVDGEPLIGRVAGTMELSRFAIGNLARVEVVKGQASSLYGSEALGGVVNLISKTPQRPFGATFRARYSRFNALDVNADVEGKIGNVGLSLFANRNSTDGYALNPASGLPTIPPYVDYTLAPKLFWDISETSSLRLTGRINTQTQDGKFIVGTGTNKRFVNDRSTLTDWNVAAQYDNRLTIGTVQTKITARLYTTRYRTTSDFTYADNGAPYDKSSFDQSLSKAEIQADATLAPNNLLTLGVGGMYETVLADRIASEQAGVARSQNVFYAFVQDEWLPLENLTVNASARYDANSAFGSQLSPKLAVNFRPFDFLTLRASVGSGFKAPTFQQLYLDFTNPVAGYSVFGAVGVKQAMERLQARGEIVRVFQEPSSLGLIKPESSWAFNFGATVRPLEQVTVSLSAFRNNLTNLIEASPIAAKSNGQNVFTYFNLASVFTQGLESDITVQIFDDAAQRLTFSAGYQYLESGDNDVIANINANKIFKRGASGFDRAVQTVEYGGLFNRSRHSGNVKLFYEQREIGFSANVRGIWRDRYGWGDANGNRILDDDSEYVPAYMVWNITASQRVFERITLTAGVENLGDFTQPQFIPVLAGRVWFVGVMLEL